MSEAWRSSMSTSSTPAAPARCPPRSSQEGSRLARSAGSPAGPLRPRVVVVEEHAADLVDTFALVSVVLYREVDGVDQIRVVGPPRCTAEDGDVAGRRGKR